MTPQKINHNRHSKKPWKKFKTPQNEPYATNEAIDLIAQMLYIDHSKRITAKEALTHPYFAELTSFLATAATAKKEIKKMP